MMNFATIFLCAVFLPMSSFGKIEIILHETFEKCVKPEEEAGVIDMTSFELIAESDSDVFMNGSVKFLKEIKAPWIVHAYTEKFIRGQWSLYAMEKKISDFCAVIHKKSEIWYNYMKDLPGCPLEQGVSSHLLACLS
jgi:hypothetical protein